MFLMGLERRIFYFKRRHAQSGQIHCAPELSVRHGVTVKWEPDVAIRKKILVDNPARLYGFDVTAL
jgi:hypothetical protein